MIKRDVLKHKKEVAILEAFEKRKKSRAITKWLKHAFLIQFMQKIKDKFVEKKIEAAENAAKLMVNRMGNNWKRKQTLKRGDGDRRLN